VALSPGGVATDLAAELLAAPAHECDAEGRRELARHLREDVEARTVAAPRAAGLDSGTVDLAGARRHLDDHGQLTRVATFGRRPTLFGD
jgi:hypothetical protein